MTSDDDNREELEEREYPGWVFVADNLPTHVLETKHTSVVIIGF